MPTPDGHLPLENMDRELVTHWQGFKTGDFKQKWDSSKQIIARGRSEVSALLALLEDPATDGETRWFTIRALGHFPDPTVIAALVTHMDSIAGQAELSEDQAAELSSFTIETLAAMGPLAVEVLSRFLTSPRQRRSAAKALNQIRSSQIIPAMATVVDDDDALVRYYAIDALGSFHNSAVTPLLIAALRDRASRVRKAAVMALGRRRDLQTEQQLSQKIEPLLWDISVDVSCQAALALGRLGDSRSLPKLEQVLLAATTPLALRIDAVRALGWYQDRSSSDRQLLDLLARLLRTAIANQSEELPPADATAVAVAIVQAVANYRRCRDLATDILLEHLTLDTSPNILQPLIMALASLGAPQTFEALLPLLYHSSELIAIHTIAALKQLDRDGSYGRVQAYVSTQPHSCHQALELW